jgi:transketolase
VRVVSCPAPQKLARDPIALNRLVPDGIPTVAVEAGAPQGWADIVGRSGAIFAMTDFGASAPAETLTQKFGFTPEAIAERSLNYLNLRVRAH